jgi:copper transport protein
LNLLPAARHARGVVFVVACLAALAQSSAALAHASLVRSEPSDRAVVAQSPAALRLTFNEPVSPLVLQLVSPTGETVDVKHVAGENATIIVVPLGALARGTHLLSWRVISADGHPVGGAITFSVAAPSAAAPGLPQLQTDRPLRWAIWAAKLILYVGLFGGIGGAFYAAWIATEPLSRRTGKCVTAALDCGLVAAVISVGLQGADAFGLPLSDLREPRVWMGGLATSYGLTAGIAAGALVFGRIAMWRVRGRLFSTLALAGVGAALAASGHASSAEPQLLTRPAVFVHGIVVAFWIGALVPLAAVMRSPERRAVELARFSRAIPTAIILLIASGISLAIVQLRQVDALWTTAYGLVLCGKLIAVLALVALAALNRFALTLRVVAGDSFAARRITRSIAAELLIALLALGFVAAWRFTPPPRALFAAAEAPVHVHIHSDRAMADLTIEPAAGSGRQITVSVLDGQFGPLLAKEVTLVLAKPEAGIEPLRLPATHVESTIWRIDRVYLPMLGGWRVRVEILVNDFEKIPLEDRIDLLR